MVQAVGDGPTTEVAVARIIEKGVAEARVNNNINKAITPRFLSRPQSLLKAIIGPTIKPSPHHGSQNTTTIGPSLLFHTPAATPH